MGYSANILSTEAYAYELNNATIANNVLSILPGGTATQVIDITALPKLTETFKFTCIATLYADNYKPNIFVTIHAKHAGTQLYYNAMLYPVQVLPGQYDCIFSLDDGDYTEMYVTISSDVATTLTLWELRPEASDADIETIIDGVKQSLPRLLYDYNTFPFDVYQAETTIAVITCRLLQNTDLQGHFLFTFTASANATVTLRFYDNEAEELFAPLFYDAHAGYNTIGIPHAYLQRLAGIHSFTVTAQAAAGSLHIDTRRILFTIDGGYLAIRELDVGMDVTDLAVRQLASSNGPDELWLVGLDAGEALVRRRKYAETNAAVAFDVVGSLGRASIAAIEFDGRWVLRAGADQYTLETEEDPWYFWVNNLYELCACHGLPSEENPHIVLSTAVSDCVKACRGYSSTLYAGYDQGLIVAYIKYDGHAYYRQYAYNTTSGIVQWEPEVMLPFGTEQFTGINVHRLNDYRVGFELSGERNVWLISGRTYVGQSAYPENGSIGGLYEDTEMYEPFIGYYTRTDYPTPNVKSVEATTETLERAWVDENHEVHRETYTVYRWAMTLDKAIFGSQLVKTNDARIVSTNIRDPINKEISYNLLSNETIITIESEYPPQGLIVTITLNADNYLRIQEDGIIYPYITGSITGTIDNTNYIECTAPDDNGNISAAASFTATEYSINYPRINAADDGLIAASSNFNIALYGIVFSNIAAEEPYGLINASTTYTIFYADSRYEPV